MINYFFYTDSFKGADTALIKSCIEDLNKAVLERSRHEAFYEDYSFYTAEYAPEESLYQKLLQKHPDLTKRLIPSILSKMKHSSVAITSDLDSINAAFPDAWLNSLWGNFAKEDKNHIMSLAYFRLNRKTIAESVATGGNWTELYPLLFDRIRITADAEAQISKLGSSDAFNKVLKTLCLIDKYNAESWQSGDFRLKVLLDAYNVTVSDESDTVKRTERLKRQRLFKLSDKLGSQYCYYHAKLGDIRIHIYPDAVDKIIYIAYVGAHLDLG